jgi:glycosyltransferase involved in cell wall biosynthesis
VHSQSPEDRSAWEAFRSSERVRHLGFVDPDHLPDLYAACDAGLIPYKELPFLVESNFSLKALEMMAAGLPFVSTPMRSLIGLSPLIEIASGAREVSRGLETVLARRRDSDARAAHRAAARHHDYDLKMEEIERVLAARPRRVRSRPTESAGLPANDDQILAQLSSRGEHGMERLSILTGVVWVRAERSALPT